MCQCVCNKAAEMPDFLLPLPYLQTYLLSLLLMALARLLHHHNASLAVPYNCRGWNSGGLTLQHLVSSCDVCFIQEHWLHTDQLHKLNAFNSDFLSVAVSGMDSGSLLCGRPYGGCSVLYRKSLSSCIIPLASS